MSAASMSESRGVDPRVFLLAIGTFATGTDTFVIAGILPELARSFSVNIETAGTVVSVYALIYGIGTPLLALVVGRWRQDRVALAALVIFIAVNLLCAVAPSFALLIVMRAAAALCAAAYAPAAYVMAAASARPEKRGSALAAVALGSSGSTVAGVPRTADIPPPLPLAERVAPLARLRVWIALAPVLLMFCGIYALYTYIAP